MNDSKLLSIIIPVYGVEKYIEKCLLSILPQAENLPVEVIIVNDGTKDKSMIVAEYLIKRYNPIVINQENGGLSKARNVGLSEASGKYIWFFDSDDWMPENTLEMIIDEIKSNNVDSFLIKISNFNENGVFLNDHVIPDFTSDNIHYTGLELFNMRGFSQTPIQEYIIQKDILAANNLAFKQGIYHEDMEFAPRLLFCLQFVKIINRTCYCYLVRNQGSIVTTPNFKKCRDLIEISKNYLEMFKSEIDPQKRGLIGFTIGSTLNYAINQASENKMEAELLEEIKKVSYRRMAYIALKNSKNIKRGAKFFLILLSVKLALFTHKHLRIA